MEVEIGQWPVEGAYMKLSVIMPCLNGAETIVTQLEALANQRSLQQWELIVADNGSTDESMAIVDRYKRWFSSIRVVDASDRRGAAHALNVGARAALGESLAFCDVDDEVAPDWVAAMGEALTKHEFVACRTEIRRLNAPWVWERWANPQEDGIQEFDYPAYLPHAGQGTLGVRRSLHEAIGGFDESLFQLHETDYCWRIQRAGIALHFVPDAVVHLRYRNTLRGMIRQARGWGEYDVLLYKRYRPLGMPPLSWRDGLHAWKTLLLTLPQLRSKPDLARWMWVLAWHAGRLQGCLKYRVFAL